MKLSCALTVLALSLVSSACVVRIGGDYDGVASSIARTERKTKSPTQVAYDNRENLACLSAGMTVAEVLDVMDEETWGTSSSTRLSNPHRRESFPMAAEGRQADVLFFYTDTRHEDGRVSDDELTPVYFEDGRLVGWGPFGFGAWKERVLGL